MAHVVLGVTGGIAAYKAALLLRLLTADGHEVQVVPTANALRMVGETTWRALSGRPVHSTVWEDPTEHVELGKWADLVVVAPATAHTIARAAHGLADDLLAATLLVATCPVLVVPAMHTQMWEHPATRANVATLRGRGVVVMEPAVGRLTGPDSGPGRLPEPEQIHAAARALLAPDPVTGPLTGAHVLVTAGGTREPLDPVRFLGNRSSGRQGIEVARAAAAAGARVDLVAANVEERLLEGLDANVTRVTSAADLEAAVLSQDPDVVVMAAAVADFRPDAAATHKLKKADDDGLTLRLEQTPDILAGLVARRRPGQVIVGFAAETGDDAASARRHAESKARRKGADLLVFNEVSDTRGFGDVPNDVVILDAGGAEVASASGTKAEVARRLIGEVVAVRARLG